MAKARPPLLSEERIQERLKELDGWEKKGNVIEKLFKCGSFRGSLAFVQQVADLAEAANHHPDIYIRFHRVTLTLTTHSAQGLTDKDFDLARQIDQIPLPGA